MTDESERSRIAWQALTFKGVANFAYAKPFVLPALQLGVAILCACGSVWFVNKCWIPVIEQGIDVFPPDAAIVSGQLQWPSEEPERLAEGPFLEMVVTPGDRRLTGHTADIQCELMKDEIRVRSLFGYIAFPYPGDREISLNREELISTWGAWRSLVRAGIFVSVAVGLMLSWSGLSFLYNIPALLFAFYLSRPTSFTERYKVAGAALMPGAFLMCGAIALYGVRQLSLVAFLVAFILHLLVGWIYLAIAIAQLPAHSRAAENPFADRRK